MSYRDLDWKFYATTTVAVLGLAAAIVVPFLAWKMDLQARSISVRILASTSLQPIESAIDGLKITLGDAPIEGAFISTLTITNDGSKPIPAGDFESPIELLAGDGISIVRAQVADRSPINLPVVLKPGKPELKIEPLLLNPGDLFKVVVITAGGKPSWTPSGRIAGVTNIRLEQVSKRPMSTSRKVIAISSFFLGAFLYVFAAFLLINPKKRFFSPAAAILTMVVSGLLSGTWSASVGEEFGLPINSAGGVVAQLLVLLASLGLTHFLINIRQARDATPSTSASLPRKAGLRKS